MMFCTLEDGPHSKVHTGEEKRASVSIYWSTIIKKNLIFKITVIAPGDVMVWKEIELKMI